MLSKRILVLCVTDHSFKSSQLHLLKPPIFQISIPLKKIRHKQNSLEEFNIMTLM